ncbi:PcfJ domain-containing protein [Vibrio mediterranei]|uniref:PcfJ domain-containing protein n=1 Tax=Vibrio mediterranei TaxID=689 RepID=UPI0038CE3369
MISLAPFPNGEVYLTPSVTQALYARCSHALSGGVITWSALRAWLDSQCWMRLVKRVERPEADTLELCGFYRIVKHHRTQVVTFERKTLQITEDMTPEWSWKRSTIVLNVTLQSCSVSSYDHFESVLTQALDALLKDMVKQGISKVEVKNPHASKRRTIPKNDPPMNFDVRQRSLLWVDIESRWGRAQLIKRLTGQFFILGTVGAFKSLYKHLWAFVDKPVLSLYLKIHQCSLSATLFREVHALASQKLDVERFQLHALWLPWLSRLDSKHYHHPELFSYAYLLPHLPDGVTKNMVRKINQQPRRLQCWLIEHLNRASLVVPMLGVLQAYPSSIIIEILNYVIRKDFMLNKTLVQVVQRWAHYFLPMAGRVKVRKQQYQWYRAINQFQDVLGWIASEQVVLHKNQTWHSLVQQHERWIARLNAENQAQAEAQKEMLDAMTWTPCERECSLPEVEIEEVISGHRLRREGREMEHCVFSYLEDCVQGRYRVFSLKRGEGQDEERATLGLYQDAITWQCQYDQLRGAQNQMSSRDMKQVAKQLIQQINAQGVR